MHRLEGKIALISGGARGQGAAEAELFIAEGAEVIVGDVLENEGKEFERVMREKDGNLRYVHLDVRSESDWGNVISNILSDHGRLDILVNNAGVTLRKLVHETTEEEWDHVQNINSKGVFLGTKASIPAMRASGGGSIVNISSIAGLRGSTSSAYSASKGAVRLLTKSTAIQYASEGIRCNSVHPGLVETRIIADMHIDNRSDWLSRTPLGFFAEPIDIAYAVLYLASDESRYVTGSELVIDGGITAK